MKYEYSLFERISCDLSKSTIIQDQELSTYKHEISKKHPQIHNILIANFKKGSKGLSLNSNRTICSLHPEAQNITQQLSLFYEDITAVLDKKALKNLGIYTSEIDCYALHKGISHSTFYIKTFHSLDQIDHSEIRYYYYNLILKEEVARIKKSISNYLFQLRSSEEIENYIHLQQQALTSLCFQVMSSIDPEKEHDVYKYAQSFTVADIKYLNYIALEDLLRFFEANFLKYINVNIQIPYRSELIKSFKIDEKLIFVTSALIKSSLDPELLQIIKAPFTCLRQISLKARISYKELLYLNTFLTAFHDQIHQNNSGQISHNQIINILHQFNYNSPYLSEYKISLIKDQLAQFEGYPQQIDHLYHCLKLANQRHCMYNIAYMPDLPPLKQQLINWLEEEISYLNKKAALNKTSVNLFHEEPIQTAKMETGLSVSQLSYFFRVLSDVGIITQPNQSEVIRFLADSFQTSKTKSISIDSVRNKFYNVDESTRVVLKDFAIKILNKLKD